MKELYSYAPGRPPNPETLKQMEFILKAVRKDPGVRSAKIAQDLKVKSARVSTLARRLEKKGLLLVGRCEDGALAFHLPETK